MVLKPPSKHKTRTEGMPITYVPLNDTSPVKEYKVRTGPGKPGKSWNSIMAFSRTGKSWKKATAPGSSGNLLNSTKKYEVYRRQ